jgi:hypothetical protein
MARRSLAKAVGEGRACPLGARHSPLFLTLSGGRLTRSPLFSELLLRRKTWKRR